MLTKCLGHIQENPGLAVFHHSDVDDSASL